MAQPSIELRPLDAVATRMLTLRGARVIIDADLAALCGVPTRRLNEQVKRNAPPASLATSCSDPVPRRRPR